MKKVKRTEFRWAKPVAFTCMLVSSLFMCCQDEDPFVDAPGNGNHIIHDDTIVYTDIIPDDTLVSIDSMLIGYPPLEGPLDYFPIPPSGGEIRLFDVDGDGEKDLRAELRHSSIFCDMSTSGGGFYYYMCLLEMTMLDKGDSLTLGGDGMYYFKENDTVRLGGNIFRGNILMVVSGGCFSEMAVSLNNAYFGIKQNGCLGWVHLHRVQYGVIVMDHAINLAPGRDIVCRKP